MKRSNGSATPVTVMVTGAAALALAAGLAGCHNASDSSPTGRGDTTATTPMNPDSPTLPNSDWSPMSIPRIPVPRRAHRMTRRVPPGEGGTGVDAPDPISGLPPGYDVGSPGYHPPSDLQEQWNQGG
jgi:hypothetical protein